MTGTISNNEVAFELVSIIECYDFKGDLALALEKIDALAVRLWTEDGTALSKEVKQKLFYSSEV